MTAIFNTARGVPLWFIWDVTRHHRHTRTTSLAKHRHSPTGEARVPDPCARRLGRVLWDASPSLHPGCGYSSGCPEKPCKCLLAMDCGDNSRGNGGDMADQKLPANSRTAGKETMCLPAEPILSTTGCNCANLNWIFKAVSTSETGVIDT